MYNKDCVNKYNIYGTNHKDLRGVSHRSWIVSQQISYSVSHDNLNNTSLSE